MDLMCVKVGNVLGTGEECTLPRPALPFPIPHPSDIFASAKGERPWVEWDMWWFERKWLLKGVALIRRCGLVEVDVTSLEEV